MATNTVAVQEKQQQTKDYNLRKANLFFIKSKHVFKNYKNHDYFEDQTTTIKPQEYRISSQFVKSPTPYGISNAYDYICQELSKNNLKKYKTHLSKTKTIHQRYEDTQQRRVSPNSKHKTHFTLPNLSESKKQDILQQKGYLRETRHQHRQTNLTTIEKRAQIQPLELQKKKGQYFINLVYVEGFHELHEFQLRLNIHSYILNTFLKTRINYYDLTQEQFQLVLTKILQIYPKGKEHMEFKDLVNLRSVKDIFGLLQLYCGKEVETRQTLRYFFVANRQVYEYQFNRIKDQIKERLRFQFQNMSTPNMDIFMFEPDSGIQISDLYDLVRLNRGKLIFGMSEDILGLYRNHKEFQNNKKNHANRINKWKNIISDKTISGGRFRPISVEKYQHLFQNAQKKRSKFTRTKKKSQAHIKNSQFINREELLKDQNIFQ